MRDKMNDARKKRRRRRPAGVNSVLQVEPLAGAVVEFLLAEDCLNLMEVVEFELATAVPLFRRVSYLLFNCRFLAANILAAQVEAIKALLADERFDKSLRDCRRLVQRGLKEYEVDMSADYAGNRIDSDPDSLRDWLRESIAGDVAAGVESAFVLDSFLRRYRSNKDCTLSVQNRKLWRSKVSSQHDDIVWNLTAFEVEPGLMVVCSASADKRVSIWNANTFQPIMTLDGHCGEVTAVAPAGFRQNREMKMEKLELWSGSDDCYIKRWCLSSGQCKTTLGPFRSSVRAIYNISESTYLLGYKEDTLLVGLITGEIYLLQAMSGTAQLIYELPDAVTRFFWCEDTMVAVGCFDKIIRLIDFSTGALLKEITFHSGIGYVPNVCPTVGSALRPFKSLVTCSYDSSIAVWDISKHDPGPSSQAAACLKVHQDGVRSCTILPDGTLATCSYDGTVHLVDMETFQEITRFTVGERLLDIVAISDSTLVTGTASGKVLFLTKSTASVD